MTANTSGAAPLDLVIEQGATFSLLATWKDKETNTPRDLTGWTAKAQVRSAKDNTLIIELSTANGRIVLGSGADNIALSISDEDTAALPAGNGVWDLFLTDTLGKAWRLLAGAAQVRKRVTQ